MVFRAVTNWVSVSNSDRFSFTQKGPHFGAGFFLVSMMRSGMFRFCIENKYDRHNQDQL